MHIRYLFISILSCVLVTATFAGTGPALRSMKPSTAYVQNMGQWDPQVRYCMQSSQGTFWICNDGFVVDSKEYFVTRPEKRNHLPGNCDPVDSVHGHVLRFRFTPEQRPEVLSGVGQQSGVHNYVIGSDQSKWRSNVPLFNEVQGSNTNKSIQTRYYVDEGSLRYDLIVGAGIDPSQIQMSVEGALGLHLNSHGDLVIATSIGEITQRKLVAYQQQGKQRVAVPCTFVINNDASVGFKCSNYNRSLPLVIDPILWSTYIGGRAMALTAANVQNTEDCLDMTLDAGGNPVMVGTTQTNDFPTTVGAYSRIKKNLNDTNSFSEVFISKFSAAGALLFSTYYGGKESDYGRGICLDNDTIYICGGTYSLDFPTTAGVFSRTFNGQTPDAFIAKFSPDGASLVASTLIGGSNFDQLLSIKVNSSRVYACGWSLFDGWPTTLNALQQHNDQWWCSVACVFNKSLSALQGSTYFGGRGTANDLALDPSGNMFITGVQIDTTFPTTPNAVSRKRNGIFGDAFVIGINPTCTTELYGTYIGGELEDVGYGICFDASNNIIVCGSTQSDNWPTTVGAYDRTYNYVRFSSRTGDPYDEYYDGIVFKLSPTYQLLYSTYIGGRSSDWFQRVTAAPNGSALLTGISYSPDYPATSCCIDSTQNGVADVIFTALNPTGNVVTYSTFLGGGGTDIAYGIARQSNGNVYICGSSWDATFPTTAGSYQPVRKLTDGILMKIDPTAGFCVNAGNDILYSCVGFGTTVYLAATPACGIPPYTYSWTPTTNLSDPHSDKPVTFTTKAGIEYQVTVTDAAGSIAVNTVSLVPLLLNVKPGSDTVVCWGRNTRLNTKVTGGMGRKTYQWYPGLGLDSSNIANPLANPDTTTMYVLIVTDTAGCQQSDSVIVRISRSKVKSTRDTTLCGVNTVKLAPRVEGGINPLAFKWTTKGSAVLSTSFTPTFTVDSTTTYYLAITDSLNCVSRDSIIVRYSPPTVLKLQADSIVCKGTPISVKLGVSGGQPPFAIRWKASDASLALGGKDSTLTATIKQTTTFTATTIDSLGCSTSKTITVKVDSASSPRITSEGNKKAICSGAALQLDAGTYPGVSYLWSTGEKTQKIKVSAEGWYIVSVKNKNGCEGKDSVFIRVQQSPTAKLSNPSDTVICEGTTAMLRVQGNWSQVHWSNGVNGPKNEVSLEGTYYATVSDSLGCTGSTDTVTVHISKMQSTLNGPNSLCAGIEGSFAVDTNSAWTYSWTAGKNGQLHGDPTKATVAIAWSTQGPDTISVTIKDSRSGCTVIRTLPINISTTLKPVVSIDGASVLCGTSTTTLRAPAGYDSYQWSTGANSSSIVVSSAGRYAVRVVSGGCSGTSDTITIQSAPPIIASISGDSTMCSGSNVPLSVPAGFVRYLWSTGDTTSSTVATKPGSYSVTIRDTNGCELVLSRTVVLKNASLSAVQSLNFNTVLVAQSSSLKLSVPNTSNQSISVKQAYLQDGMQGFSLLGVLPSLPGVLTPSQSLEATIKFSPTELTSYSDTLVIIIDAPCADTLKVAVLGRGTKDSISATLWMTPIRAKSGDIVRLPVYCRFSTNQDYNDVDCQLSVSLNANVFYLQSQAPGTLRSNTALARERTLTFDLTNVNIKSGAVLCELVGEALTDRDSVTLTTPSITWIRGVSAATKDSAGSLTITGCRSNYFNLVQFQPLSLQISPNPAEPEFRIDVASSSDQVHHLQVFRSDGSAVLEETLQGTTDGLQYSKTVSHLASGVYLVVVRSGSEVRSERLSVIR